MTTTVSMAESSFMSFSVVASVMATAFAMGMTVFLAMVSVAASSLMSFSVAVSSAMPFSMTSAASFLLAVAVVAMAAAAVSGPRRSSSGGRTRLPEPLPCQNPALGGHADSLPAP